MVGRKAADVVAPNASSAGPVTRSFATVRVRLDDGSEEELSAYWHVPPEHLAQTDTALPGLPLSSAFKWLSEPLRKRVAADARVLCSGGAGLELLCGATRLRLEPAPDGEVLMLKGISGHVATAGPAVAALGDRGAELGGELMTVGGELQFRILGIEVSVGIEAVDGGALQVRSVTGDGEEIVEVPADGVRTALADTAGYLSALGDLSVAADGCDATRVPGFGNWLAATTVAGSRRTAFRRTS